MSEMISIQEWADRKGISKQWAITLAGEGRLPGAAIVDNYRWMLPADTPSPTRKRSERMIEAERKRVQRAMEKAQKDEYYAQVRARIASEEAAIPRLPDLPELDAKTKAGIDWIVQHGRVISTKGFILEADADGNPVGTPINAVPGWNDDKRIRDYYLLARKRHAAVAAPVLNPDWPSNEYENGRAYDIKEGVLSDPPLSLDAIKAQLGTWGADEQAYYDSLVAANPL